MADVLDAEETRRERRPGGAWRWLLARFPSVSEDVVDAAAEAAAGVMARLERQASAPKGDVLVVLALAEGPAALAAHRSERIVPRPLKELAAERGFDYVVVLAAGLFEWERRLVEAVFAHELAHVALGHCDSCIARFVTQFGPSGRMLFFHCGIAADGFAARLGYGRELVEVLARLREASRTVSGKCRTGIRIWMLRQILAA